MRATGSHLRVFGRIVVAVIGRGSGDHRQFTQFGVITVVFGAYTSSIDFLHWNASAKEQKN